VRIRFFSKKCYYDVLLRPPKDFFDENKKGKKKSHETVPVRKSLCGKKFKPITYRFTDLFPKFYYEFPYFRTEH